MWRYNPVCISVLVQAQHNNCTILEADSLHPWLYVCMHAHLYASTFDRWLYAAAVGPGWENMPIRMSYGLRRPCAWCLLISRWGRTSVAMPRTRPKLSCSVSFSVLLWGQCHGETLRGHSDRVSLVEWHHKMPYAAGFIHFDSVQLTISGKWLQHTCSWKALNCS